MGRVMSLLAVGTLLLLSGCRTHEVVTERVVHYDSVQSKLSRDSIRVIDSVFITERERGDTVFVTKESLRYVYVDRLRTDTVQVCKSDTVAREVTVSSTRSRWWDVLPFVTGMGLAILIGVVAFTIRKRLT